MSKHEIYRKLANLVQKALDEKGMTSSDIARKIGVSPAYMTQFLKHGQKTPAERIEQILDVLGYELTITEKKTSLISVP